MRWIKELFKPKLKCERIGHKLKTVTFAMRTRDSSMFWVLVEYKATQEVCRRCGFFHEPVKGDYIKGFSSVTMPDSMWDKLREKGYLYDRPLKK